MSRRTLVLALVLLAAAPVLAPVAEAGHDFYCDTGTLNPVCRPAHAPLQVLFECTNPLGGCLP